VEKINVVLVALNNKKLAQAVRTLNLNKTNLVAVVVENINSRFLIVNEKKVPIVPFPAIQKLLDAGKNFLWLISGFVNNIGDIWTTKKFLMNNGVPENNIINFEILPHISSTWLGNLRYIEENGADFFATGISYTEVGLDLNYIPHARGKGVNLSGSNQDLRQGYLTAKYVFAHVAPGTIKFVLIGLAPYSLRYENAKAFSVCSRNLQYMLALNIPENNRHDSLLKTLISDGVKDIFKKVTAQQADLNFSRVKKTLNAELPVKALVSWEAELDNLTKKLYPDTVEKNFKILKDYIKLCHDNGAKPIGVIFPFAPAMQKNYDAKLLTLFRLAINQLEESYDFKCVDLFGLNLGYDCFYNMAHLNLKGAAISSSILGLRIYEENLLPTENFCDMSYDYFNLLLSFMDKEDYNELLSLTFEQSIKMIRRKDKIKVGFVTYDSSMWCGDDLYNFFANDERFEPTIFLCLRTDKINDELVRRDFQHGINQFKARGLNVVAVDNPDTICPTQDLLIFLTLYLNVLPKAFQLSNMTAQTLLLYIPYGINLTEWDVYDKPIYHVGWKFFLDMQFNVDLLEKKCRSGMPRGFYSGYPKLDVFFKADRKFHFDWKMARPDARKIIWAPHWSITGGVEYSTFQWNYKFMYDFAKAHPEISWVVKPHPNLLFSAVESGLFASTEAFKKYLQAWNDLPNAQVYTGAYYQDLFATSDGMIHDCGSFIGEYQYTHKPMIFLTRDTQKSNEVGKEILKVSYLVDGKNLKEIGATMQKIFIEGNDPTFKVRMKFFDEHLNYFKHNGMTASEFIFKNVADELKNF